MESKELVDILKSKNIEAKSQSTLEDDVAAQIRKEAAGRKKNTKDVDLTAKLFDEIAPKYTNRNGGYTRIVKIGQRRGDGAMEVVLELV